ncbi:hypothetical protein YQE_11935, partial [Dendroctonus ponderosae]
MDFFLWAYVKNEIYKITPTAKDDMKERITTIEVHIVNTLYNVLIFWFKRNLNGSVVIGKTVIFALSLEVHFGKDAIQHLY